MPITKLSEFQQTCKARVQDLFVSLKLEIKCRTDGINEIYLCFDIPQIAMKIWVYSDEAEYSAGGREYRYEAEDYPDVSKRIDTLIASLASCAKGLEPSDAGTSSIILMKGEPL